MTYFPDDKIERWQVYTLFDDREAYKSRCYRRHRVRVRLGKLLFTIKWRWRGWHQLHVCIRRPWFSYHRGSFCMCEINRLLDDIYPDTDLP